MFLLTRRGFLKHTATLAASAGLFGQTCVSNASDSIQQNASDIILPSFVVGNIDTETNVEFFWSASCSDTKKVLEDYILEFTKTTFLQNNASIVFHHTAIDKSEVDICLKLLSVGKDNYPSACFQTLQWMVEKKKRITKRRIEKLLKRFGYQNDLVAPEEALFGVYLLRKAFDGFGFTKTPALTVNGQLIELPSSRDEFYDTLNKQTGFIG
ncbi:MAG: twin-arginine translocation signal domain-containing protein [Sedimenticola sp.]